MNSPVTARPARSRTAVKIVGSLAVLAAAGAVAGLGTFGTFTDSTSVDTLIDSGTVSIDVGVPGGPKTIPVTTSGFVPGDSLSRAVNLTNDGDSALASIALANSTDAANALVTDEVNGLQLTLRACSRAWTMTDRRAEVPAYSCEDTEQTLYSGPVLATQTLSDPASLNPGGGDHLVFTISLPTSAGNQFQSLSATVSIAFTAVQRAGAVR
ncbi:camelysin-like metallo-endopeptidase [Blastococcus colisei]|uniref:Camelysin-like metallo-endopeptidase n=1 Tax=Blastococcus colisei TaxID=1564162 RepID=A0A543PJB9_9ACTN|nr:TasA family protein [Blastococcus colisei]TQN44159.1 camelysin-like metallo-endopeptidase [Blastococcus colisei]